MKECRSPYCECDKGCCTAPGFVDARHIKQGEYVMRAKYSLMNVVNEQHSVHIDLLENKREELSIGIAQKKEEIIKMAINQYLGKHDWLITDIIGRCNMNILPDKTEVFQMDGINLVEIYPAMFKTEEQDGITVLTAVQEYRHLTKEK